MHNVPKLDKHGANAIARTHVNSAAAFIPPFAGLQVRLLLLLLAADGWRLAADCFGS